MATTEAAVTSRPAAAPKPKFPFLDLKAQYALIKHDVLAAVNEVLESQHFILGPEVEQLEKEIAGVVGAQYAISCASGSDALLLALMALEIGDGDEVITTPFTFGATAGSIARLKAKPVFVDIDPVSFNIDPARIQAAITARTKAIMPVHLFGLAADMDPINDIAQRHGLAVIEDAAQAIGSWYHRKPVGVLGTLACFSFFPSKNLGGAGDGGLVSTNDSRLAERLKMLRMHGTKKKYNYQIIGMNSRLDALQAAILRVKLPHLTDWAEARARNAARYRKLFAQAGLDKSVVTPPEPSDGIHVYNQFTIRVKERDALRAHMALKGIPTEIYYPTPLHVNAAYQYLGYKEGEFPQAENAAQQVVSLPIFAELTDEQQSQVVESIVSFYGEKA